MEDKNLVLAEEPIGEKEWIQCLKFPNRGRVEGLWFEPGQEEPKIEELDTYISGVVRQLNRLGFHTTGSCDGHERRVPHVLVTKERDINQMAELLFALGMKRVYHREQRDYFHVSLHLKRNELLDLAEKMSVIEENWLELGIEYIKEQMFYISLEQLLSIPGESGNESQVREFVKDKLHPFVDFISTDRHGNILAEKTYKSGSDPTILLNAHLDTAFEIESDRKIIKADTIWSSNKGILGADDRAGVAVLLNVAEYLVNSNFSGKVKYIFTVEEESGLVGARNMDEYFLWGTGAAIVVDRRGKGDIVTSCGGSIPFCDGAYGEFFEEVAAGEGLTGWNCTNGGSSDTRIWAEHGIQSVNLSVGYMNEHTDEESLDIEAAYETVELIKGVFNNVKGLRRVMREIERKELVMEITG
ncbi:M20/M25/M40 family metallo-hydrolase [Lentibacillus sediminis]|uniref:M20/M25/M40 family metallo-hydrolase n=1 Tax=Lentibacillus sediminis TaxID=1940529 RepID=UPI001EFDF0F2|nr:M20/M25/M40 family metallo-hydrolase [Lentibacillus sediminis]